jgi:hypothetical protein
LARIGRKSKVRRTSDAFINCAPVSDFSQDHCQPGKKPAPGYENFRCSRQRSRWPCAPQQQNSLALFIKLSITKHIAKHDGEEFM